MLYPERLAYDVFKFGNAVTHLTKDIPVVLPDSPVYTSRENAEARTLYLILSEGSRRGISLAEIILLQIKEYNDAKAINDTRRSG